MGKNASGHCLNLGSAHEFQQPEGVRTSLALHLYGLVGGKNSAGVRIIICFPSLEKRIMRSPLFANLTLL